MSDRRRRTISEDDAARFHTALRARSPRQGRLDRVLRVVVRVGFRLVGWRVQAAWTELPTRGDVPGAGCVVAAAPHRAWVDPFLLILAWPPDAARLVWLADGRTVSGSWWRRRLLPRLGIIPIEGSVAGLRTDLGLAGEVLRAGAALVVFPEVGPPSPPDRTRRLSPGFALIAEGAAAPIVPVVIGGTHRIVRGSMFTVDGLDPIPGASRDKAPMDREAIERARQVAQDLIEVATPRLVERNAFALAHSPRRARWAWLRRLFD